MHQHKHQTQSSEEEGFYANKIQIKQSDTTALTLRNWSKILKEANAFQSRYLPAAGVFRKEPEQALKFQPFIQTDQEKEKQSEEKRPKLRQGKGQHPYKLYSRNEKYNLVYTRKNQDPILNQRIFLRNKVKLQHVGNNDVRAQRRMPSFQEKDKIDQCKFLPTKANILKIDSRFQCGNLHCAYKKKDSDQYILFIQNDTNSLGYNQWFYFSIQDNKANHRYTFRIVNFKKKHSFYKYGAKPYIYSSKQKLNKGKGWKRRGFNIYYQESPIHIQELQGSQFYCLSFDIEFQYSDDYILVSMGLPYSYTKLTNLLKEISSNDSNHNKIQVKIQSICKTLGGNDVPEVTITKKPEGDQQNKKMIIIMARQHPGQVWSSHMAESIIRYLLNMPYGWQKMKDRPIKQDVIWLLENYVIKIFPMVNIDGVTYGNFRCDLTGTDLNRRWKETSRLLHPQVYQIKQRVRIYVRKYTIPICFDLHGHSKNFNIFCYSCKKNAQTCRILPLIIEEKNPIFYFPYCTFGLSKYKETTARAALFKIIKNQNVLTIQTSFFGSRLNGIIKQFHPKDIFQMGEDIIDSLKPFLDKSCQKYAQIKQNVHQNIQKYKNYDKINQNDSGSQSDPQADQIDLNIRMDDLFDHKYVNKTSLQIDNNQVDNVEQNCIVEQIVEKQCTRKHSSQQECKKEVTKVKVRKNQIYGKPPPLSNQFKTIEIKRQKKTFLQKNIIKQTTPRVVQHKNTQSDSVSKKMSQIISPIRKPKRLPIRNKTITPKNSQTLQNPDINKDQSPLKRNIYSSLNRRNSSRNNKLINQSQMPPENITPLIKEQQTDRFQLIHKKFSSAMRNSKKIHGALFDQTIYNQDQSSLLSVLFNNKKMLQDEKQKRFHFNDLSSRQKSQSSKYRWQSIDRSDRIKRLFNKSGYQLANIIAVTPRRPHN